ncbi:hypothetical protein EDD22DRAFT_957206 [Suillus occidentalis]|nr:hypothetical protein EDD22DRAFT_957206 [Suillus occidentalis]
MLPQWQVPVLQSVTVQYGPGDLSLELSSSQSQLQWQVLLSSDPQHFHPPFTLTDTHILESPFSSFQVDVTENLTCQMNIHTSHKCGCKAFTYYGNTKHAASSLKPIPLSSDDIKTMKDSTHKDMVQRVFEMGLFPTMDEITRAANTALNTAIGSNINLRRWKTMQQGRFFIGRLKAIVNSTYSDFQKAAPVIVLASNQSLTELLMTEADMQALQISRLGNLVHNASSFDVTIRQSMENGVFKLVQAPLAHPSVTALLDYMLVTKKYSNYLCTDTGNWQAHLEHAFAFSAAICHEELWKFANTGWINTAADDFSMSRVKAAYNEFVDHISSLVGDPKMIFDLMLSSMCQRA